MGVVGGVPVVDGNLREFIRGSQPALFSETGDDRLIVREYGIELRCVGFVEISREFVFACEQHLFSVVEFYFKGYKQVSVVVGEVRRSVFAAGLV